MKNNLRKKFSRYLLCVINSNNPENFFINGWRCSNKAEAIISLSGNNKKERRTENNSK